MITFPPINRITTWVILVIFTAVSFTWSERLNSVGIVLLIIHWLADPNLLNKLKSIRFDILSLLLFSFIGLLLLGLIQSNNIANGWQSIEVKLTCIILPILFSTEHYLTDKRRNQLLLILSFSCIAALTYSAIISYCNYHEKGWSIVLNRVFISESIMHAGYFSNYFALGFTWCVYELIEQRHLSIQMKIMLSVLILCLLISILLLASKTVMIYLACFFVYLIWRMTFRITLLPMRITSFVFILIGFMFIALQVPRIKGRIDEAKRETKVIDKSIPYSNSTGSRVVAYQTAIELIQHHWLLGYGTGDANDELKKEFINDGYVQLAKDNMHTHMQVFHTWIDVGILGVLLLLSILLYALFVCIKRKRWLAAWFTVLIVVNILTDDMFEIQAGIVFFMFFLLLFINQKEEQKYYGPSYW